MLHIPCGNFCIGATSPEKIRSARTADDPSGILIQCKPPKRRPFSDPAVAVDQRFLGLNKGQG